MQGLNFMPWRTQREARRRYRFCMMVVMTFLVCAVFVVGQELVLREQVRTADLQSSVLQQTLLRIAGDTLALERAQEDRRIRREHWAELNAKNIATDMLTRALACLSDYPAAGVGVLEVSYHDQVLRLEGRVDTGGALDSLTDRIARSADSSETMGLIMRWHPGDQRYEFGVGIQLAAGSQATALRGNSSELKP